jgi:hypothetical protein
VKHGVLYKSQAPASFTSDLAPLHIQTNFLQRKNMGFHASKTYAIDDKWPKIMFILGRQDESGQYTTNKENEFGILEKEAYESDREYSVTACNSKI